MHDDNYFAAADHDDDDDDDDAVRFQDWLVNQFPQIPNGQTFYWSNLMDQGQNDWRWLNLDYQDPALTQQLV